MKDQFVKYGGGQLQLIPIFLTIMNERLFYPLPTFRQAAVIQNELALAE